MLYTWQQLPSVQAGFFSTHNATAILLVKNNACEFLWATHLEILTNSFETLTVLITDFCRKKPHQIQHNSKTMVPGHVKKNHPPAVWENHPWNLCWKTSKRCQQIFPSPVARLIAHKSVADFGCLGISPVVLAMGGILEFRRRSRSWSWTSFMKLHQILEVFI